ncbi:unnamed protein product, partial [Pylaiella littoralis]
MSTGAGDVVQQALLKPSEYVEDGRSNRVRESSVPDALAFLVNGKTEVWPPSGFIDVLSDTEVIEVQYCRAWKNGIGQIVAWGFHYLRLARRLHLLAQAGDTDTGKYVDLAKAVCDSNAIKVTFEEVVEE